jgi:carbon storage regulator
MANNLGEGNMLVLTRNINSTIIIDGHIKVMVLGIQGRQVRIGIEAPKNITVHREEIQKLREQELRDADDR